MVITTYISIQQNIQKKRGEYVMTEEKTHLSVRAPKRLMKDIKIIAIQSVRAPKRLMKDIKIIAIQQDTTVTKIILDYLEEYVKEHKK